MTGEERIPEAAGGGRGAGTPAASPPQGLAGDPDGDRSSPTVGSSGPGRIRRHPDETVELFVKLSELPEGPERQSLRATLLERYQPLVTSIVLRYRDRGEPVEDLLQVGRLGLVHAIDRFDLSRGVKFITYATSTILGEVKRYFRDQSWGLKVPRRLQELNLSIRKLAERLSQELGRSATIEELARAVGETEERTLEALELGRRAHDLLSLDRLANLEEDRPAVVERIAGAETASDRLREMADLRTVLEQLPPRLRDILTWKFIEGYTQVEMARRLGISQMHVSRLQARALKMLRQQLKDSGADDWQGPS